jgi:hypothetical protein
MHPRSSGTCGPPDETAFTPHAWARCEACAPTRAPFLRAGHFAVAHAGTGPRQESPGRHDAAACPQVAQACAASFASFEGGPPPPKDAKDGRAMGGYARLMATGGRARHAMNTMRCSIRRRPRAGLEAVGNRDACARWDRLPQRKSSSGVPKRCPRGGISQGHGPPGGPLPEHTAGEWSRDAYYRCSFRPYIPRAT